MFLGMQATLKMEQESGVLEVSILLTLTFVIGDSIFDFIPFTLTIGNIITSVPSLLLNSILASGTALIPLYFGMKKKSVSTQ